MDDDNADSKLSKFGDPELSVNELCERVGTWLDSFREEGHFAVVTHPFVIRAAILHALQASTASFNLIDIEPLAIVDLRFNERWRLRF